MESGEWRVKGEGEGENLGELGTVCDVIESLLKEVVDLQWTKLRRILYIVQL